MIKFFKNRKKINELNLDNIDRVYKDINWLKHWVNHLHLKNSQLHSYHSYTVEITNKEINKLKKVIIDLAKGMHTIEKTVKELIRYSNENNKYQLKLYQRIKDIEDKIWEVQKIKEELKRTSQGHVLNEKDTEEDKSFEKRTSQGHVPLKRDDDLNLKPSHNMVLELLIKAEDPLDYGTIARILGIKEKTIRNIIYELRKKGYIIESKRIGFRKKGLVLKKGQVRDMSLQMEGQVNKED